MVREHSDSLLSTDKQHSRASAVGQTMAAAEAAEPRKNIRIVTVDDERILAETLAAWLEKSSPRFRMDGHAVNAQAGWELCEGRRPDLALIDVGLPKGDGLALAKKVRDNLPEVRVIILTGRVDPHTAWRAHQIGVHGLVDKTTDLLSLHQAIMTVIEGGNFISPSFQEIREGQLSEAEAFHKVLSDRELEVLFSVTEGFCDAEISGQLGISADTVACHRKNIRKKLELHDDRSLIAYGRKWGTFGAGRSSAA